MVKEISKKDVKEEFRVCPSCGYELGFHVSFIREEEKLRIVLICPNCGARFDIGWLISEDE